MVLEIKKKLVQLREEFAIWNGIFMVLLNKSYHITSGYPRVEQFEHELEKITNSKFVLGVNSGSDALIMALKTLNIGPGDEVIVPAFSFISTASCVIWVNAKPVFTDIDENFSLNISEIKKNITPRTKAIIIAHLYGTPSTAITEIIKIAKQYNIFVIEDASQAFCAKIKIKENWQMAGTIGDIGCFSFSPTKSLSAIGQAGAMVFKNEEFFKKAKRIRYYGAEKHYYNYPEIGNNSILHEIQASAIIKKIPFIEFWTKHRISIAKHYSNQLKKISGIKTPHTRDCILPSWYSYIIRTKSRDSLYNCLIKEFGNPLTRPYINYPVPLPYFFAFKTLGHKPGDFPVSEMLSKEVISLPINNSVSLNDVKKVCDAIHSFFKTNHMIRFKK